MALVIKKLLPCRVQSGYPATFCPPIQIWSLLGPKKPLTPHDKMATLLQNRNPQINGRSHIGFTLGHSVFVSLFRLLFVGVYPRRLPRPQEASLSFYTEHRPDRLAPTLTDRIALDFPARHAKPFWT